MSESLRCNNLNQQLIAQRVEISTARTERDRLQTIITAITELCDADKMPELEKRLLLPCTDSGHGPVPKQPDKWCQHCSSRGDGMELMAQEVGKILENSDE